MNKFIATLNCAVIGVLALPICIDRVEISAMEKTAIVEAQCPDNCKGDFPISSKRKYAHAYEVRQLA